MARSSSTGSRPPQGQGRRRTGFAAIAVAILAVAGCSSSSSSGQSGGGSGGSSSNGGAAGLADVRAELAQYSKTPTDVGVSTPLSKPASSVGHKSVIYVQNPTPDGQLVGQGVQEAAQLLGWNFKTIPYQQTAAAIQGAFNQAVAQHPDAIFDSGSPVDVMDSQRSEMAKAGIPFITCCAVYPSDTTDPPLAVVESNAQIPLEGRLMADWMISKTNAKVHALLVTVPAFTILQSVVAGEQARFSQICPSTCKSTTLNATLGQIGTKLPSAVVSAIQRDPSINYVSLTFGTLGLGLTPALAQAGLTGKVRVVAHDLGSNNLAELSAGTEEMGLATSNIITGWRMVDVFLRHLEGDQFPWQAADCTDTGPAACTRVAVVTKLNGPFGASYEEPADYRAQFKKLWSS
jgi:ribose transport system substrate-binding protein